MSEFLLVRGDDLVVLGIRLQGYRLESDEAGRPVAVATGAESRMIITFPPQHIGEEATPRGGLPLSLTAVGMTVPMPVWSAMAAGPSRLAFRTHKVVLTIEGVLKHLSGAFVEPCSGEPGPDDTAIELPWRLQVSPAGVWCRHPVAPLRGDTGANALWRTRVVDTGGGTQFPLRVLRAGLQDDFDPSIPMPLSGSDRRTIAAYGLTRPATAQRLELSALGGSLSVHADWGGLAWRHQAVLGRDMAVEVVRQGRLLPFNHRAAVLSTTKRLLGPGDRVASLEKHVDLIVAEPLVWGPADPAQRRLFPFGEVELTQTVFADLRDPGLDDEVVGGVGGGWREYPPPTLAQAELGAILDEAESRAAQAERALEQAMISEGWDYMSGDEPFEQAVQQYTYLAEYDGYARAKDYLDDFRRLFAEAGRPVGVCFAPTRLSGKLVQFPVRCQGSAGDLQFTMPMVFVADLTLPSPPYSPPFQSLTDPHVHKIATDLYREIGAGLVTLAGVPVNLIGSDDPEAGDVNEVHRLTITPAPHRDGDALRPELTGFQVALPALRTLLGGTDPRLADLTFTQAYRDTGEAAKLVFETTAEKIRVDFTDRADRAGGLVVPLMEADAISRTHGPVQAAGLRADAHGHLKAAELFEDGASLLGFSLPDLIGNVRTPPAILATPGPNGTPDVTMRWPPEALTLRQFPPFFPHPGATLDLEVTSSHDRTETRCTVRSFSLVLPKGATPPPSPEEPDREWRDERLLQLDVESVVFRQHNGERPIVELNGLHAEFCGLLKLLKELQETVDIGKTPPRLDVSERGVVAQYGLQIPEVKSGAFVLRNISFTTRVEIPFDARPISVGLSFASRQNPFALSVLMFGGGGYIELLIDRDGLERLEASLEFGALVEIDFYVARGEVHALGGIRFAKELDGSVSLTGYIRIGGCVEVLELVSVSIELMVALTYDFDRTRMTGRATIVIEIDLTLYADTVEIDSGEWELIGGDAPEREDTPAPAAADETGPPDWVQYRKAFASHE